MFSISLNSLKHKDLHYITHILHIVIYLYAPIYQFINLYITKFKKKLPFAFWVEESKDNISSLCPSVVTISSAHAFPIIRHSNTQIYQDKSLDEDLGNLGFKITTIFVSKGIGVHILYLY